MAKPSRPTLSEYGLDGVDLQALVTAHDAYVAEAIRQSSKSAFIWLLEFCLMFAPMMLIVVGISLIVCAFTGQFGKVFTSDVYVFFAIYAIGGSIGFYFLTSKDEKAKKRVSTLYDFPLRTEWRRYEAYQHALREYNAEIERRQVSFWKSLNGYQFEEEIAKLYRKLGYEATVTPGSNDGGVDVELRKNGARIAVQCKAHEKKIPPSFARELYGVVVAEHYSAGVLATINGASDETLAFCAKCGRPMQVIDVYDIIRMYGNNGPTEDDIFERQAQHFNGHETNAAKNGRTQGTKATEKRQTTAGPDAKKHGRSTTSETAAKGTYTATPGFTGTATAKKYSSASGTGHAAKSESSRPEQTATYRTNPRQDAPRQFHTGQENAAGNTTIRPASATKERKRSLTRAEQLFDLLEYQEEKHIIRLRYCGQKQIYAFNDTTEREFELLKKSDDPEQFMNGILKQMHKYIVIDQYEAAALPCPPTIGMNVLQVRGNDGYSRKGRVTDVSLPYFTITFPNGDTARFLYPDSLQHKQVMYL